MYTNLALRSAIFELLEAQVAPKVSKSVGRPGMPLWTILVCGVIRLDLNCDCYVCRNPRVSTPLASRYF